jgi:hypothetical protein
VLRDTLYQLLEARYGYVSPTESIDLRGSGQTYGITSSADYSVPAYVDARRRFHLIDSWWKKLNADGEHQKQFTLSDGQLILERWQQEAQPQPDVTVATDGDGEAMPSGHTPNQQLDPGIRLAARVAAEELALRIERHK